ncbi:MAG: putative Ig domain-containing protein [Pyrinomonadaceae bacterium]|nr:putative Ig domain-containing protein [Pyrinomonadaceae bacterium]
MRACLSLKLASAIKRTLLLLLLLPAAEIALAGNEPVVTSGTQTGTVGAAFSYQISATSNFPIVSYGASGLPAGLIVNTSTGVISGTPTAAGTYPIPISATNDRNNNNTGYGTLTLIVVTPSFVGFRLPDFQMSAGSPNVPRLMLQMGATSATANPFNVTLEVDAGGGTWIPYNRFAGIDDSASWVTNAPLPVRDASASSGTPRAFAAVQLTQSPPAVLMKADPRSTRFGIFQIDTNPTTSSRIMLPLWPSASPSVPNGFGGVLGTDVEHVPLRFSGSAYYPGTLSINGPSDSRDNATTTYADNDGVTRPADAIYPGAASTTGASTPYYTASTVYHPILLNRPFQNVAEIGYVFRDLPWKTLDFFTDKSADAGLLDVFCINDGSRSTSPYDGNGNLGMMVPSMAAGSVNLNSSQAADLQTVLAGAILDEISSTTVNKTGSGATDAPVLATNIVNATSTIPMQSKAELVTRATLPTTILPTASSDNQAVKARREVVPRAISSVANTRVWNLMIDVVAQSGRYAPGETDLRKFIVEGEQHYWVHVAIDRFTGEVIDRQIEPVNE